MDTESCAWYCLLGDMLCTTLVVHIHGHIEANRPNQKQMQKTMPRPKAWAALYTAACLLDVS